MATTNGQAQAPTAATAPSSGSGSQDFQRLMAKSVKFKPLGEQAEIEITFEQCKKWISGKTKQGHVASDGDIIKFMMLCKSRGLNPWVGDAYLIGYDSSDGPTFSLVTSVQSLLKRAELNPSFDGIEYGTVISNPVDHSETAYDGAIPARNGQFLLAGWARVYRKDRSRSFYAYAPLETYDKGIAQWKTNKSWMIAKCAIAAALRLAFPSQISELYCSEEIISESARVSRSIDLALSSASSRPKTIAGLVGDRFDANPEQYSTEPVGIPNGELDGEFAGVDPEITVQ